MMPQAGDHCENSEREHNSDALQKHALSERGSAARTEARHEVVDLAPSSCQAGHGRAASCLAAHGAVDLCAQVKPRSCTATEHAQNS
jgi:hypothetical protein